jgi:hypothetical protein
MQDAPVKPNRILVIIGVVCALPVAAAFLAYYVWPPSQRMNHGDLIEPLPMPAATLATVDGGNFSVAAMKGKWILVATDSGECTERCRAKLYAMRQVRIAQGKDMGRLERVWLLSDDLQPAPELLVAYKGTWAVRAANSALLAALPAPRDRDAHLYVIDPTGKLMMRFPENPDPTRVIKDMARLLRPGRIGA